MKLKYFPITEALTVLNSLEAVLVIIWAIGTIGVQPMKGEDYFHHTEKFYVSSLSSLSLAYEVALNP